MGAADDRGTVRHGTNLREFGHSLTANSPPHASNNRPKRGANRWRGCCFAAGNLQFNNFFYCLCHRYKNEEKREL
jgi:hypothetical protein